MCTAVCRWQPGGPVRILAIRDEFTQRPFDDPGEWWPQHPGIVGGRDQLAGGTWCVSDLAAGVSALVLNRPERREGRPSRGLLPLAAVRAGEQWQTENDCAEMASFNLVLAGPAGLIVWEWNGVQLRRFDLAAGTHVITSAGVDDASPKAVQLAPRFAAPDWYTAVTAARPADDPFALIVRHVVEGRVYATVFGQLITASPGSLQVSYSRTPWLAGTWQDEEWPAPGQELAAARRAR